MSRAALYISARAVGSSVPDRMANLMMNMTCAFRRETTTPSGDAERPSPRLRLSRGAMVRPLGARRRLSTKCPSEEDNNHELSLTGSERRLAISASAAENTSRQAEARETTRSARAQCPRYLGPEAPWRLTTLPSAPADRPPGAQGCRS